MVSSISEARWCVTSPQELAKCEDLQHAITQRMQQSSEYPPPFKSYQELPELKCVQVSLDANVQYVQPNDLFTAGFQSSEHCKWRIGKRVKLFLAQSDEIFRLGPRVLSLPSTWLQPICKA